MIQPRAARAVMHYSSAIRLKDGEQKASPSRLGTWASIRRPALSIARVNLGRARDLKLHRSDTCYIGKSARLLVLYLVTPRIVNSSHLSLRTNMPVEHVFSVWSSIILDRLRDLMTENPYFLSTHQATSESTMNSMLPFRTDLATL